MTEKNRNSSNFCNHSSRQLGTYIMRGRCEACRLPSDSLRCTQRLNGDIGNACKPTALWAVKDQTKVVGRWKSRLRDQHVRSLSVRVCSAWHILEDILRVTGVSLMCERQGQVDTHLVPSAIVAPNQLGACTYMALHSLRFYMHRHKISF